MQERIIDEIALLRNSYPDLEYIEEGGWVKIPKYPLPTGWNREQTDVAFQIPTGYAGVHPYGIYVPTGLRYNDVPLKNYKEPAENQIPFEGVWGIFSWQPENWNPSSKITAGSNLWTWARSFAVRFKEGA